MEISEKGTAMDIDFSFSHRVRWYFIIINDSWHRIPHSSSGVRGRIIKRAYQQFFKLSVHTYFSLSISGLLHLVIFITVYPVWLHFNMKQGFNFSPCCG